MAQDPQKLVEVLTKSNEILYSATTVFPFTLFPDTVNIDREKMTVHHRTFFRVAEITSIHVDDILNIKANVGPFFGSITLTTKYFDKPFSVKFLKRNDATNIKRILHGYNVARAKEVDCASFGKDVLVAMLYELGRDIAE